MYIKFIKTLDIFDEIFYPIFYSYIAEINNKEKILLSTFAYYDEENDIDYFYNTQITKKDYKKLLNGKKDIREIYMNSITENFFTNDSPENLRIIEPVTLNRELKYVLPDAGLYISKMNEEYQVIDFKELKKDFGLNKIDLENDLFYIKPKIKEQINDLIKNEKSYNGVIITFGDNKENLVLNVIGKLMTKTGDLFRKVNNNQLNLEVLTPFESSFGISMNVSRNGQLDLENDEINKFIMLLKMVSNMELFNEELIALYQKTEREDLSSLLQLISKNKIEMNTVYFNYNEKTQNFNKLQTNRITAQNAESFIDKISEQKKEIKTIEIPQANLYKVDIHRSKFGLVNAQNGEDIKGSINSNIDEGETFNVPSTVKVTIKKIIEKNEFTQSENIRYSLESMEKVENDSSKEKN